MPYEGTEDSLYRRIDGLTRTQGDKAVNISISQVPLNTFSINQDESELEQITKHFMGGEKELDEVKNLLLVSEQLKTPNQRLPKKLQEEQSLLTDYLLVLNHNNFNSSVLKKFKEELHLRVQNYMNQQTLNSQDIYSNNKFVNSLSTILPYVERTNQELVFDSNRSKRLTKRLTTDRNKKQQQATSYEMLLYARTLNMPIIMNILDERFLPLEQAEKIVHDIYDKERTDILPGKKLYESIGKKFQKITSFTLSEPNMMAFISRYPEEQELKIVQKQEKNNTQKQNYA